MWNPADLTPILPELFLALSAMALLILGVFRAGGEGGGRVIGWLSVLALIADFLLIAYGIGPRTEAFGGLYVTDGFAVFMKGLILTGSAFAILISAEYNERRRVDRFEFPVLILFATVGMLAMVSANDLITLYVGLELQSLALYVLAAFRRDQVKSTEAGLKYFVLGALSSGMLLFGASLIYGFGGSTSFDRLATALASGEAAHSVGLIIGIVFLAVGLAFKCSAVPFHMWTPDVYEGAPTPVTAFFAVAPKIAALALLFRVFLGPLGPLVAEWHQIIWMLSLLSMALGAYAAISQTNIKRLMAYSSIGHVGYALIGLAAAVPAAHGIEDVEGVQGLLVYMAIYLFMTLGTFCVILVMERQGRPVEAIADLAGLSRRQPLVALALAIFMFSLAGVPPLAGFFGKIMVFMAAIHAGMYVLATLGVLTSVVGCYYYIRVVKLMYFDEPAPAFDRAGGGGQVRVVMALTALMTILLIFGMGYLTEYANAAALSLFR
jgi:NADH-quinone oxidoreductase subunit N